VLAGFIIEPSHLIKRLNAIYGNFLDRKYFGKVPQAFYIPNTPYAIRVGMQKVCLAITLLYVFYGLTLDKAERTGKTI
jgi:hypothetical protein